MLSKKDLLNFHKTFNYQETNDLKYFTLGSLMNLRQVKLNYGFLKAAVAFWDKDNHVFRFRDRELCATVEEFSAILGISRICKPAEPALPKKLTAMYEEKMGINDWSIKEILFGEKIHLPSLLTYLQGLGKGFPASEHKVLGFVVCLLGVMLLRGDVSLMVSAMLLKVAGEVREGLSTVHLVVAETIISLDRMKTTPDEEFSDSPFRLQVNSSVIFFFLGWRLNLTDLGASSLFCSVF